MKPMVKAFSNSNDFLCVVDINLLDHKKRSVGPKGLCLLQGPGNEASSDVLDSALPNVKKN